MRSATAIRLEVESKLAKRIPCALSPAQRQVRPVLPTGIPSVDNLIGGFPEGAIAELTGPESSGRTSLGLAYLARITKQGNACAWIDAADTLDGAAAAGAGVDLTRLLWVRCGVSGRYEGDEYAFALPAKYLAPREPKKGLHGGGFGKHPRTETQGLSDAMGELFARENIPVEALPEFPQRFEHPPQPTTTAVRKTGKPWGRIEQALKATDLILHAGGFAAVVLDLGGIAPEYVSRVELSVWFRYRAAVERSQSTLVLLTKHPSAKSAGELLLRLHPGEPREDEATIFTGVEHRIEVERRRFADNVVSLQKPPQSTHAGAMWKTHSEWALR